MILAGLITSNIKIFDAHIHSAFNTLCYKTLHTLLGHKRAVQSLTYSQNNKYLASGSTDNTIKIWDANSYKLWHAITGHTRGITCIAYSPDNKFFSLCIK